jgi:hypothetical protein
VLDQRQKLFHFEKLFFLSKDLVEKMSSICSGVCGQFRQHFTISFLVLISFSQNIQIGSAKKVKITLDYAQAACKMLVKFTPLSLLL